MEKSNYRIVFKYKNLKSGGMYECVFKAFKVFADGSFEDVTRSAWEKIRKYSETASRGDYSRMVHFHESYKGLSDVMVKTLNSGYPAAPLSVALGEERRSVENEEIRENVSGLPKMDAYFNPLR